MSESAQAKSSRGMGLSGLEPEQKRTLIRLMLGVALLAAAWLAPPDGEIIKGETDLDTSSLTGESQPRAARPGDAVYAGTVNQSGVIEYTVALEDRDSAAARVMATVEQWAARPRAAF